MNLTSLQTRDIKTKITIIIFLLNCYFGIRLCLSHIEKTYMVLLLAFNIISFAFIIFYTIIFGRPPYLAQCIIYSILISTIIFSLYYSKIQLF